MFFRAHGNVENRDPSGFGMAMMAPVGRNRLINGDFSVNQRGFSSSTVSEYIYDRWLHDRYDGTSTCTAEAESLGSLPESAASYVRIVPSMSVGSAYSRLCQRIEGVRVLSGKTVTVSFWARSASGNPRIAISLRQYFGSSGSTPVETHVRQVGISTSWTRYAVSVALPSLTGKTINGTDYLELRLWVSAGADFNAATGSLGHQSNTFDIWGVQLEDGAYATAYEQKAYHDELRACQRYYWRYVSPTADHLIALGQVTGTTSARVQIRMPTQMRAVPTIALSASTFYLTTAAFGVVVATPITQDVNYSTDRHIVVTAVDGSGSLVAGHSTYLYTASLGAWIYFTAEL